MIKKIFDNNKSVNYLKNNRNKFSDLYKSEKYFFNKIKNSRSFLDLGCGVGGLMNILKKKTKIKNYIGLDISKKMIEKAKFLNPDGNFFLYDGKKINIKKKVDTSFCFGTLHYCENYKSLINQIFKISRRYIIFDLRLAYKASIIDSQKSFQFIGNKKKINYNIVNFFEALDQVISITKRKNQINIYGYYDYPAKNVRTIYSQILMVMFCIDKNKKFEINIKLENEK